MNRFVSVAVAVACAVAALAGCADSDDAPSGSGSVQATAADQANPYAGIQLEKVLGTTDLCWSLPEHEPMELAKCAPKGSDGARTQTFTLTWIKNDPKGKRLFQIRRDGSNECLTARGSAIEGGACTALARALWSVSNSQFASADSRRVVTAPKDEVGVGLTLAAASTTAVSTQKFDISGR